MVKLQCKICRNPFLVLPYRAKTSKCCSNKCAGKYRGPKLIGNKGPLGCIPWNKNKKGIHLSPKSEFKRGHKTWNKGANGLHLSPESEFKKGHTRTPRDPIGTIKIRKRYSRKASPRKFIKVAHPNVWIYNARFVFGKLHKLIPGMVVHHADEDSLNDVPSNLKQLTRAEHARVHKG